MKRKVAPADVIQQARTKLRKAINHLVFAHGECLRSNGGWTEQRRHVNADRRVERAISVYTRTVRNCKSKK